MARSNQPDAERSKAVSELAYALASETLRNLEDLAIDRNGEIPIGVQLAWALRARIGDGRLAPRQRLPGLRELAEMLGINANTARAVYQRLEQENLIESRQGTGTFVASVAPEPSAVGRIAADAARQARRTGVDLRKVAAALYVTSEPPDDVDEIAVAQAADRRRELRAQIAALEQALVEIQARHPDLIPAPSQSARDLGPRLLSVEELESVRTKLARQLAVAEPSLREAEQEKPLAERCKTAQAAGAETFGHTDAQQTKSLSAGRTTRTRPSTRPSTA